MALSNSKLYNDMIYDTRPVKLNDFLSNKYNIVHRKLYQDALNKYIEEWINVKKYNEFIDRYNNKVKLLEEYKEKYNEIIHKETDDRDEQIRICNILNNKIQELEIFIDNNKDKYNKYGIYVNTHNSDKNYTTGKYIFNVNNVKEFRNNSYIIEIFNDEYWKPSICRIMTKYKNRLSPNLKWDIDLTPYWNFCQRKDDKDINNIKFETDNIGDLKLVSINYVAGTAKFYSQTLEREVDIDFDYIDGNNIKFSDDFLYGNINIL